MLTRRLEITSGGEVMTRGVGVMNGPSLPQGPGNCLEAEKINDCCEGR